MPSLQTETATKTVFQVKLILAFMGLAASLMLARAAVFTFSSISNTNTNFSAASSPTPTPTPTPETGCCEFSCSDTNAPPDKPDEVITCKQTTKEECVQNKICGTAYNCMSVEDRLDDGCKVLGFHEEKTCDTTQNPPACQSTGCCSIQDQWGNGIACFEGVTQSACDEMGGKWDDICRVCDKITNTCRDQLCCQCENKETMHCSDVRSAEECLKLGCKPSRGQCNQGTGQCEPSGCCELPGEECSGPVTASECTEQGGAWHSQGKCDRETGKCTKLGCCQGAGACTQSTQDECPDNLPWIENAECNYAIGACEDLPGELKMTVDIKPDTQQYVSPISEQDLTCFGRVENYKDYNIIVSVTGTRGKSFAYNTQPCAGDDPCAFAIVVPNEATLGGDEVICAVTAINNATYDVKNVSDVADVQSCVYLDGAVVPKETANAPLSDAVFVPDGYADNEIETIWKTQTASHKNKIVAAAPFSFYKSKMRFFRVDTSGNDGSGEPLNCVFGQCRNADRLEILRTLCPSGKAMALVNHDEKMETASADDEKLIAVAPSKKSIPCYGSAENLSLHEFGHLWGLADEYKPAYPSSLADLEENTGNNCYYNKGADLNIPCGEKNGGVFGLNKDGVGWCTQANPNPVIPKTSVCYGRSDSQCENIQGCRGRSRCNDSYCSKITNLAVCGEDPKCSIETLCFLYKPGVCMDYYGYYNIGLGCRSGTGCYPGCYDYRSAPNSLMNAGSSDFNAVQRTIIKKFLDCETKLLVACPFMPAIGEHIDVL